MQGGAERSAEELSISPDAIAGRLRRGCDLADQAIEGVNDSGNRILSKVDRNRDIILGIAAVQHSIILATDNSVSLDPKDLSRAQRLLGAHADIAEHFSCGWSSFYMD